MSDTPKDTRLADIQRTLNKIVACFEAEARRPYLKVKERESLRRTFNSLIRERDAIKAEQEGGQ